MEATTRLLTPDDLPFAHSLSRLAGWNQTLRDWERFLALAPGGCFLAAIDGKPAGTATTTSYGEDLAWIGMVLVHPDHRRRGIGTLLLKRAIAHLRQERGIATVALDATPEGMPLYEGLGFQRTWALQRWALERGGGTPRTVENFALNSSHLDLDRVVFGADRSTLLRSLAEGSVTGTSHPDGSFGFLRKGQRAHYLGPLTAASVESGLLLAESLIASCPGDEPVFWDIPEPNRPARELAEQRGFKPARHLTRMRLGEPPASSDPLKLFAIAEPGLG